MPRMSFTSVTLSWPGEGTKRDRIACSSFYGALNRVYIPQKIGLHPTLRPPDLSAWGDAANVDSNGAGRALGGPHLAKQVIGSPSHSRGVSGHPRWPRQWFGAGWSMASTSTISNLALVSLSAVALMSGCSQSEGPQRAQTATPNPDLLDHELQAVLQFCEDYQAALVGLYARCSTRSPRHLAETLVFECDRWVDEVEAGRSFFDDTQVPACLGQIDAMSCQVRGPRGDADLCATVMTGMVDAGGVCEVDSVCSDGLYCHRLRQSCHGKCQPKLDLGEQCQYTLAYKQCGQETYCSLGSPGTTTCVERKSLGEACDSGQCAEGLVCGHAVCEAPGQLGESCTSQCAGFLVCVGEYGSATCELPNTTREACRTADDCSIGHCGLDGYCTDLGSIGEPCGMNGAQVVGWCTTGYCDAAFSQSGVCRARMTAGKRCEFNEQCESFVCEMGLCARARACQP